MNQNETIDRFLRGPEKLQNAISGLTEEQLDLAMDDQTWSIRQIIHHVTDGDDIWKTCIKAALGNAEAVFSLQWYWDKSQMHWAEQWEYAHRPITPSLNLLAANRQHIAQLFATIPDAWNRPVHIRWPAGDMEDGTLADVVEMQTRHLEGHIEDICQIRRVHGV